MWGSIEQFSDAILPLLGEISKATFFVVTVVMAIAQVLIHFTHSRPNGAIRRFIQYLGNFDRKTDLNSKDYQTKAEA